MSSSVVTPLCADRSKRIGVMQVGDVNSAAAITVPPLTEIIKSHLICSPSAVNVLARHAATVSNSPGPSVAALLNPTLSPATVKHRSAATPSERSPKRAACCPIRQMSLGVRKNNYIRGPRRPRRGPRLSCVNCPTVDNYDPINSGRPKPWESPIRTSESEVDANQTK